MERVTGPPGRKEGSNDSAAATAGMALASAATHTAQSAAATGGVALFVGLFVGLFVELFVGLFGAFAINIIFLYVMRQRISELRYFFWG